MITIKDNICIIKSEDEIPEVNINLNIIDIKEKEIHNENPIYSTTTMNDEEIKSLFDLSTNNELFKISPTEVEFNPNGIWPLKYK